MKTCTKCGTPKAPEEFPRRATSKDGLYSWCRLCSRAATNSYRKREPDKVRAAHAAHYRANVDTYREYGRRRRKVSPDAVRAQARRSQAVRRATLRGAVTETISVVQMAALIEEFNGLCGYCSAPWEHLDHYIPLARGGSHTIDNLVPACAACNLSKGSKLPIFEWIARPDLFKEVRPFAV